MSILSRFFKKKPPPRLFLFSGAGLSADSGISTYRNSSNNKETDAIWNTYDSKKYSNYTNWYENKEELFTFWNKRKLEFLQAKPNLAHTGLAKLQKQYPNQVYLATQNIDTLLEQAGCNNVLHVHGRVDHMQCTQCNNKWFIGNELFDYHAKCLQCSSNMIKPAIVLFGEKAPFYTQLFELFNFRYRQNNDIILCIGTSFEVISLDDILGYHEYQKGIKILSNYEASSKISEDRFDHIFYGSVENNWVEIEQLLVKLLNS